MLYNPQLETFLKAADAGSFSKAAEELYITPTAVIKQVTSLENGLGLQLFHRSPRGLKLTEAGKSIYKDAQYLIDFCKDALIRANNAAEEGERVIRIGTSPMTPGQFCLICGRACTSIARILNFSLFPMKTRRKMLVRSCATWGSILISSLDRMMRIRASAGSAKHLGCHSSRSAVRYRSTIRLLPRNGCPSRTCMEKTFC